MAAQRIISPSNALKLIRSLEDGKFFTIVFRKRTTGKLRVMNCRQRVKKHLKGGDTKYSFSEKGLVSVYDVQKRDYRCFALNSLVSIKTNGDEYVVDHRQR